MNMADHTATMLAANLRRLRERRKLTQQDLAERSGVPRPTLAHLESGEANPTLSVLVRVAEALGTSIEELIGRVEPAITLHLSKSLSEQRRGKARWVELAPAAFAGLSFQRVELPAGARSRQGSSLWKRAARPTAWLAAMSRQFCVRSGTVAPTRGAPTWSCTA
jgi:XRE family transcriptional regulator, regulator of sulfur utilization